MMRVVEPAPGKAASASGEIFLDLIPNEKEHPHVHPLLSNFSYHRPAVHSIDYRY